MRTKGKPFNPDARMKKILADAAAIGNAAGRVLNWRTASVRWPYYPKSMWMNMLFEGGAYFETPPPEFKDGMFKPYGVLLRLHAGLALHGHAHSGCRLAVFD